MATRARHIWRYVRGLGAPALLWVLFAAALAQLLPYWLRGDEDFDDKAMREWINEARFARDTLPEEVGAYLDAVARARVDNPNAGLTERLDLQLRAEGLRETLTAMGYVLKKNQGQLPLFPKVYRMAVVFDEGARLPPISWDSQEPRHESQFRTLRDFPLTGQARLTLEYQTHAFNQRQQAEGDARRRLRWVTAMAVAGTVLALAWSGLIQRREREREVQRRLAQGELDAARRRQEDAERDLLEQRLATQAAERQALELKSQLYASIGIMAGSYAHNIKNLLVRPNDLLRRCIEADGISNQQEEMLKEVRQTLGTVTERLQQILRTVRRDPSRPERARIDLNALARDLDHTWRELARDKWKVTLTFDLAEGPLEVEGDWSHLQQAVENLLFNARDATFEMRNHLRDGARAAANLQPADRRQALIDAAGWKGHVWVRTRRKGGRAVLEVADNGIGMTEEVRLKCTETHFTTKRDNALYEGHNTGMGLGLSFVATILGNHGAKLQIESQVEKGTVFRAYFELAGERG